MYVDPQFAFWIVATRKKITDWPAVVRQSSMAVARASAFEVLNAQFNAPFFPVTVLISEIEDALGPACETGVSSIYRQQH